MQILVSKTTLEAQRAKLLRELVSEIPPLDGSLYPIAITCGNPNCKCARGEKHTSYQLTRKVNGKTETLHIPMNLVEEVKTWTEENRRIKEKLAEIYNLGREIIKVQRERNRGGNLKKKKLKETLETSPLE